MAHTIHWFEIPSLDLDRATAFYERLLEVKLKREQFGGSDQAIFPGNPGDVRGALIRDPQREPHAHGTLIYLATPDLDAALGRATAAGGEVVSPKLDIGEPGFIALVRDSEGNVIGLHTPRS